MAMGQKQRKETAASEMITLAPLRIKELEYIYKNHNDGRECLCPYCCVIRAAIADGNFESKHGGGV